MANSEFGIPKSTLTHIIKFFSNYSKVNWVKIYGSRALGTYEKGSDIDLAFSASEKKDLTAHFLTQLDELPTPYKFDVTNFDTLTHPELRDHIQRVGKVIYHNP